MSDNLKNLLKLISDNFAFEKTNPLKDNAFANKVRRSTPEIIKEIIDRKDIVIKGAIGEGNWAEIPWIGIFNPENTTSATRGIYVVYLFSADLKYVYLCLGQGVTKVKDEFGRGQRDELLRRSKLIQSRVPEFSKTFKPGPIDLGGSTSLAKEYDDAVAFYYSYENQNLPSADTLSYHLKEIYELYDLLISRGGTDNVETALELTTDITEENFLTEIIEKRRYVRHARIERNSSAAKAAKKALGLQCSGCGFEFERFYGERGRDFIEVHHLIPLHTLPEGAAVSMDPKKDFAVVCSNCHKIIHRGSTILTIEELR
jgi:5-methylcytosine-specific restriction enzyme A